MPSTDKIIDSSTSVPILCMKLSPLTVSQYLRSSFLRPEFYNIIAIYDLLISKGHLDKIFQ